MAPPSGETTQATVAQNLSGKASRFGRHILCGSAAMSLSSHEAVAMESGGEAMAPPSGKNTLNRAVGAVLGAAVLLAGGYALGRPTGISARSSALQNKEERLPIVPSFPACSKSGENCYSTGCCQVSGHKCYTKSFGVAQCNETCTPGLKGFSCGVVGSHSVPVASKLDGKKLYCFAVYTKNTASTKKSYELELLQAQKKNGISIFACEAWDAFGEFHQIKRKTGAWVNWGMFYQVWVKVREVGKWQQGDYVVKADADAVFVPQRLREWLGSKGGETPHGVYFENCPNVQYGFFGNLEVMSRTAASVLTTYLEDCHAVFAPCANTGCDWKFGPWGEDVFMQRCLDHHYVDKVEAWDLTTDGACEADRPEGEKKNKKWHAPDCSAVTTPAAHPFKKPDDYMKCMSE